MTDEENELECSAYRQVNWQPVNGGIVVWLTEWRTYGFLLYEGAHFSTVSFVSPDTGERLIEQIENDEYEFWQEHSHDYDTD